MPRIRDEMLDCVIYLYPSTQAAQEGLNAGGSGFLVGVPSEQHLAIFFLLAVTNSHVIREGKSPVVRLNTQEGQKSVMDMTGNWIHHSDGDDLAVCPIGLNIDRINFLFVSVSDFITKDIVRDFKIGPGEEVYMVGRFINHEGRQKNLPSARFGNIGMLPWEPVRHPRGIMQESFLVEVRSAGGYSGSPVFVWLSPTMTMRDAGPVVNVEVVPRSGHWLLGVDWGHLPNYETVREKDHPHEAIQEGWVVRSNTGMAGVVPAWKLRDLLYCDELVERRREEDKRIENNKASISGVMDGG